MISKIAPLLRLCLSVDCFDYFVPKEFEKIIKPGQVVGVPWRFKKIQGVVLELKKNENDIFSAKGKKIRTRPISKIISLMPIITNYQIKLIKKFSEYYFVPERAAARLAVPDIPLKKSAPRETKIIPKHEFKIARSQIEKLTKESNGIQNKKYILLKDVSSFIWLILHFCAKEKNQILVLFPTIDLIESIYPIVQKKCSGKTAVIHSALSKGEFWKEYKKILSKEAKIIFSTRQGVFAPIAKKSLVIFFEPTSHDFKQYDQSPRYDSRTVALWLEKITESKILFASSSCPVLEKDLFPAKLPTALDSKIQIKLSDMKQEMTKKNFNIISEQSFEAINRAIEKNKKVIIISLRDESEKGVSAHKIYDILTGKLKNCKIARNYDPNKDFDILVTTPQPLEGLKLLSERKKIGLAIFSSIEPMIAIPDFRSSQRVLNKLNFWKMLCAELEIEQIILQTYSPKNLSIRAFCYGEIDEWKKEEIKNRKQLNYPPFSELIKLWPKQTKNLDIEDLAKKIKQATPDGANVIGPFKDKKDKYSFLIKLVNNQDASWIKNFSNEFVIDRDPENVL